MNTGNELLTVNVELLRSRINRYGIIGLVIALATIAIASAIASQQMTGSVSLNGILVARQFNIALRVLDFLPFALAFWGQYTGTLLAYQAGAMIAEQTDDLRAETSAWKEKAQHDSTHDVLTGLPNRVLFYDQLHEEIVVATREIRHIAVLFIDLDGFKQLNDAYGHDQGDRVLKDVTARLREPMPGVRSAARMGGDEFAVLLADVESTEAAVGLARRIHRRLAQSFALARGPVELGVSIGIACHPEHGQEADTLIQRAEAAMMAARRRHDGVALYTKELDVDSPRRVTLLGELRRAIEQDALELYYQPKVDLRSGQVESAEALMRWTHPTLGSVSPGEFIVLAENSRLIRPLTEWCVNRAARDLERWTREGIGIGLATNLSTRLLDDRDLTGLLSRLLAAAGSRPERITLEITESCIMENPRRAIETLSRLRGMKLRLSIDDFGTGYSSLAYLSKLPVAEIKIDKSFVTNMSRSKDDRAIVQATIDLGHNLGLSIVAEGVEDEESLKLLEDKGCDIAQGYFISPPLEGSKFLAWLRESRWKPQRLA